MRYLLRDPFPQVPIRIKLPLGFILLFLCMMGVGGYFMIDSVYGSLDRAILLRTQSETMTLATLFDKHLETLGRRAEDFSSDGFIRTQTERLISSHGSPQSQPEYEHLLTHLKVNKLPIVPGFIDLQIYNTERELLLSLTGIGRPTDFIHEASADGQRFSGIIPPRESEIPPGAAIITPLHNISRSAQIGYLVCIVDISQVIHYTSSKFEAQVAEPETQKVLTFVDQHGLTMEVPWWYLESVARGTAPRREHVGIRYSQRQVKGTPSTPGEKFKSDTGQEFFRQSYPLQSTGWTTTIEINVTRAMNPLTVLEGQSLGIASIVAIATLVFLFFAIQNIVRPLGELQRMAERLREGDFSVRTQVQAEDEIGSLAKILNLMAEAIEERTQVLEETASDLHAREQELRMQHGLLNTVIDSMSDGLILLNFQGQIRLSNKAAEPVLGIIEQANGQIDIQKCEAHNDEGIACITCMKDLNEHTSCVITAQDTIYEILSTKVETIHGNSKLLVVRDITEREVMHKRQAHQERLTVLGKIAAVVSHEINNPLAAISMYNQMMESGLEDHSPFKEHVEVIKRNIDSCQRITRDLLDYARTPQPDIQEVDLHDLLKNVIQFVGPFHQSEIIPIESKFLAKNAVCLGDLTQLQQVFVNLLVNAIQAIRDEEGLVRLNTASGENGTVIIDVIDSGSGITPSDQAEIFEPFFTTKSSGGTGLGLSTSRRIIDAHEGTLELVESRSGYTRFSVTLPRASNQNGKQQTPGSTDSVTQGQTEV